MRGLLDAIDTAALVMAAFIIAGMLINGIYEIGRELWASTTTR